MFFGCVFDMAKKNEGETEKSSGDLNTGKFPLLAELVQSGSNRFGKSSPSTRERNQHEPTIHKTLQKQGETFANLFGLNTVAIVQ